MLQTIDSTVDAEVIRRVDDSPLRESPFPHLYVEGIFPEHLHAEMRRNIPPLAFYTPMSELHRTGGSYKERRVLHLAKLDGLSPALRAFWAGIGSWLGTSDLDIALIKKFAPVIAANAGADPRRLKYGVETMLVKDLDGYQIGPHTDVRNRAVSIMFYLPPDESYQEHGTALYVPNMPGFRSDGRAHLGFGDFRKVATMPCRPNTMFAFARSDTSFHGVEPIRSPSIERDVLLYILRWKA